MTASIARRVAWRREEVLEADAVDAEEDGTEPVRDDGMDRGRASRGRGALSDGHKRTNVAGADEVGRADGYV